MPEIVEILTAGRYNNQHGRARDCLVGDLLIARTKYADVLTAKKRATFDVPDMPAEEKPHSGPVYLPFFEVLGVTKRADAALRAQGYTWERIDATNASDMARIVTLGPRTAMRLKREARTQVVERRGRGA